MKKCCSKPKFSDFTKIFKALGDSKRMAMFQRVCDCAEANVKELSTCCDLDLSVVSRHLSQLKKAGVLIAQKNGKEVNYQVNSKELASSLRELADFIESANQGDQDE